MTTYCPSCGAPVPDSLDACQSCGINLPNGDAVAADADQHPDGSANDMDPKATFVGTNYEYFTRKWRLANHANQKFTWNWAAFLIGPFWFAYRKMYLYIAIFMAIVIPETAAEILLGVPAFVTNAISIGITVVLGLFGNYWYQLHVHRKVGRIMADNQFANKSVALRRQGGTSFTAPAVLLATVLILGYLYIQGVLFPLPVTKAGYPLCTSKQAAHQFERVIEDSQYGRANNINVAGFGWQTKVFESEDGETLICNAKVRFEHRDSLILQFTLTPGQTAGYFYISFEPLDSGQRLSHI